MSTIIVSQADQAAASAPTVDPNAIQTVPPPAPAAPAETKIQKVEDWLGYFLKALLPVGVEIASFSIHNPASQHKLAVVAGEVNVITQLAAAVLPAVPINK